MFSVRPYREDDATAWDTCVVGSCNGTFLHTRRFMSYHGSRFADRSLLVEKKGRLSGVLPAAVHPGDSSVVVTHPGITYGGVVHDGSLRGDRMVTTLSAVAAHYRAAGFQRFLYKPVPHVYHRIPAGDDLYALFRLGARRTRCELSAAVDLERRPPVTRGRRDARRKAEQAGVTVSEGWDAISEFWDVLTDNLAGRHAARPTHSFEEIRELHARFPEGITLLTARLRDVVVAGTILFRAPPAMHSQYIASSERGREVGALDPVFEAAFEYAQAADCRFFDFGTSNEPDDGRLMATLYDFKWSFGAGGVVYELYDLPLHEEPTPPQ